MASFLHLLARCTSRSATHIQKSLEAAGEEGGILERCRITFTTNCTVAQACMASFLHLLARRTSRSATHIQKSLEPPPVVSTHLGSLKSNHGRGKCAKGGRRSFQELGLRKDAAEYTSPVKQILTICFGQRGQELKSRHLLHVNLHYYFGAAEPARCLLTPS